MNPNAKYIDETFRGREVVMTLSDKRLNFFGPKGCSPNATAH